MSTTVRDAAAPAIVRGATGRIVIDRWPTELPLFTLALVFGSLAWIVIAVTIVGLVYALIVGLFVFLAHVVFVSHVRGNGVKLGPDQFPELHARVQNLAGRMGLERVPEVYLMQAGGALNALATKFLGSSLVVLFSDLLDACDENEAAMDMIIAHELGHIRAGHLRWRFLTLPAFVVPFLLPALSRAREFTCDRYGLAGAGDQDGAQLGLAILAAGGQQGPRVNRRALVAQRKDLNTGWMTIGQWLSTHPPLARRLVALDPRLGAGQPVSSAGVVRALAIMAAALLPFVVAGWLVATRLPAFLDSLPSAAGAGAPEDAFAEAFPDAPPPDPVQAEAQVRQGFAALGAFLDAELAAGRALPADLEVLYERWDATYPGEGLPTDPYDGQSLGYEPTAGGYRLWSSGPDGMSGTDDDIVQETRVGG